MSQDATNPDAVTLAAARALDQADSLARFRDDFCLPQEFEDPDIYFVGNSLGLMPRRTRDYVTEELDRWSDLGVRGHFSGPRPWMPYHEFLTPTMAQLVGGLETEVVTMNSLTVNLHLMMATFYRPTDPRHKILIEAHAFPSDKNAVESQIRLHGFDPNDALIEVSPDDGALISTEHACQQIERYADSLALVLLPGVQYYSGQVFDMREITAAAHRHGIKVGFDLAHAAGNIELELHNWEVDFACWCTYKYLNSGPGSVAGCFIHERHATNTELNRLAGWWGHDKKSRFEMSGDFVPIPTAEGWQLSNPPILSLAAIRASLEIFAAAGGMRPLREKAKRQGQFFRDCLRAKLGDQVATLADQSVSGCQLSLEVRLAGVDGRTIHEQLESRGFRTDWREPNVIRAAPTPLYNTFEEIWQFVDTLNNLLKTT